MNKVFPVLALAREHARIAARQHNEPIGIIDITGNGQGGYECVSGHATAFDLRRVMGERASVAETVYPGDRHE